MVEKTAISSSFYSQILLIGSIAISSILGFRFLSNENKTAINDAIAPLVDRVDKAESEIKELRKLIADNSLTTNACFLSANIFIDSYNRIYHREFLRPVDITTETIVTEKLKRKR